jgi:hypothetical protein
VSIELSEAASNAMLDVLGSMMNGGRIELMSDQRVLAVLRLAIPATMPASGGEVVFNPIIEEDAALAQGNATNARIVGIDGSEIFACDVGDEQSSAVIKLNTTRIFRGGPVRLTAFALKMP